MGPGGEHVRKRLWVCSAASVWLTRCCPWNPARGQPRSSKLCICDGLFSLPGLASDASLHILRGCARIEVRLLFCS